MELFIPNSCHHSDSNRSPIHAITQTPTDPQFMPSLRLQHIPNSQNYSSPTHRIIHPQLMELLIPTSFITQTPTHPSAHAITHPPTHVITHPQLMSSLIPSLSSSLCHHSDFSSRYYSGSTHGITQVITQNPTHAPSSHHHSGVQFMSSSYSFSNYNRYMRE